MERSESGFEMGQLIFGIMAVAVRAAPSTPSEKKLGPGRLAAGRPLTSGFSTTTSAL
jgi:hypothetical protein